MATACSSRCVATAFEVHTGKVLMSSCPACECETWAARSTVAPFNWPDRGRVGVLSREMEHHGPSLLVAVGQHFIYTLYYAPWGFLSKVLRKYCNKGSQIDDHHAGRVQDATARWICWIEAAIAHARPYWMIRLSDFQLVNLRGTFGLVAFSLSSSLHCWSAFHLLFLPCVTVIYLYSRSV